MMMTRMAARLTFAVLLVVPAVAGAWRAAPQLFQTLQLEVGTNGEVVWTRLK